MPRTAAVSNLSLADLERMIHSRQKELRKLEKQRAKWQKKVDDVDRKIAALGGAAGRGGKGRGAGSRVRNEVKLPDSIAQVLSKSRGPVAVGDIMEGVLSAGYKSNSANFRGIVNQALIKDKRFGSAGRGLYQMKDGGASGEKQKRRRRGRADKGKGAAKTPASGQSEGGGGE